MTLAGDEFLESVQGALRGWVDSVDVPSGLARAIQYPLFQTAGKRLRPRLMHAAAEILEYELGAPELQKLAMYGAALELIHTYSLVHDDLPAIDNDSVRRGQPTVHVQFGEDIAILVGDALLTGAFELASLAKDPHSCLAMACLARAAGASGMVGGQFLDISTRRLAPGSRDEWESLYGKKTGGLFGAAMEIPHILLNGQPSAHWRIAGVELGTLYQMADDLMDARAPDCNDLAQSKTSVAPHAGILSGDTSAKWIHAMGTQDFQNELQIRLDRWTLTTIPTDRPSPAIKHLLESMFCAALEPLRDTSQSHGS